jgi:hypothetical protein
MLREFDVPCLRDLVADVHSLCHQLEACLGSHLLVVVGSSQRGQQHSNLYRLDIRLELVVTQSLRLDPIGNHQSPLGLVRLQQRMRIIEEPLLVGQMGESLGYPDDVERARWECRGNELGVELVELDRTGIEADDFFGSRDGTVGGRRSGSGWRRCGRGFTREVVCHVDLDVGDGHARDVPSPFFGKVARGSADPAAYVEDFERRYGGSREARRRGRREGQTLEQELDQLTLRLLLSIGWIEEITMMDVFAL